MGGVEERFLPIRLLDDSVDGSTFSCGNPALDSWFRDNARRAVRGSTARVYVLLTESGELAGFYSLSTYSVERTADVPGNLRRNAPNPIPCTLLGQLAVDIRFQGRSSGARLLQDAIRRAVEASKIVASRALVVDAADENAEAFYRHYGFRDFGKRGTLFLRL